MKRSYMDDCINIHIFIDNLSRYLQNKMHLSLLGHFTGHIYLDQVDVTMLHLLEKKYLHFITLKSSVFYSMPLIIKMHGF